MSTMWKNCITFVFCLFVFSQTIYPQLFESFFYPENYVAFQTPNAPKIDGDINESQWKSAPWTKPFGNIEGKDKKKPVYETKVKMLWDKTHLYIAALLYDKHIWANEKKADGAVFEDNDFEVFINPSGSAHQYIKLEINALGTIADLYMDKPYRDGGNANTRWNFAGIKRAVKVYGKLNNSSRRDSCWTIELAIPWETMTDYSPSKRPPVDGEQWRINFLRSQWQTTIKGNQYIKNKDANKKPLPPLIWTWSPQGSTFIDQPETWGFVQFSTVMAGAGDAFFIENPDEKLIWCLWQVYYLNQFSPLNFAKTSESFLKLQDKDYASSSDFKKLELGDRKSTYLARARSGFQSGYYCISKDGKIWFEKD
jgi:hypothetical protein